MVLAKRTNRSMEQNIEYIIRPIYIGSINFQQGTKQFNGESKVFSTNSTRITEYS